MVAEFKGTYKRFNAVPFPSRRLMVIISVAVVFVAIPSSLGCGVGLHRRARVSEETARGGKIGGTLNLTLEHRQRR